MAHVPKTFDQYAPVYADTVRGSLGLVGGDVEHYANRKVDVLSELLSFTPTRILEFGCGVGTLTRALASRYPSARVFGVDTSEESIGIANSVPIESTSRPTYVVNEAPTLPYADASMDVVIAACVFHHIPPDERSAWYDELRRVLAPGGVCAIFEHNPLNPLTRRAVNRCPFDEDAVLLSHSEAEMDLQRAGLLHTTIRHYLFVPPPLYRFRAIERSLSWLPLGGQFVAFGNAPS